MRRSGENAAARQQHQDRDADQRERNICKRHGVPPSMHRLFQENHAFRHFAAQEEIASGHFQLGFGRLALRVDQSSQYGRLPPVTLLGTCVK